jgi:hypothetical protein
MRYMKWLAVVGLSLALGLLVVQFLTVHPTRMNWYLLAVCLVLFGLLVVLALGFRGRVLLIAIPLVLVLFAAGYVIMTRSFLAQEDPRPIPELTRARDDPGLGHTAVVYFTHGEPETYDPIGWINQFNEFDEQDIPFVPLIARPIFVHQLRYKYLEVGKSDHRRMHAQMANRWTWFRTHDPATLAYVLIANALFWYAMLPELKQFLRLRKEGKLPDEQQVAEFMGMGSVYQVMQRFSLVSLFKKRRAAPNNGEES